MSRKDYIAIAEVIRANLDSSLSHRDSGRERMALKKVVVELCDVFEKDNERFDRVTFLMACGFRP